MGALQVTGSKGYLAGVASERVRGRIGHSWLRLGESGHVEMIGLDEDVMIEAGFSRITALRAVVRYMSRSDRSSQMQSWSTRSDIVER